MAIEMLPRNVAPPDVRNVVTPVLSSLSGAAASTEPAPAVLPSLAPILRQRVVLLSSASTEPWIRLLTYDTSKVPQLTSIARSGELDQHPVSGEIEVDWANEVDVRYKRLDQETLQALVVLNELSLFFRLVFCTGDPDGGGDGWRVGEVGVVDPSLLTSFRGFPSISEAEKSFQASKATPNGGLYRPGRLTPNDTAWSAQATAGGEEGDDDDDGDYWARYDATPSRTPATKRSPAPPTLAPHPLAQTSRPEMQRSESTEAEDAYFARYDSVQPAMDNHDPDEEVHVPLAERGTYGAEISPPSLANPEPTLAEQLAAKRSETNGTTAVSKPIPIKPASRGSDEDMAHLMHPRPASSASSSGSQTVAKLEEVAKSRQQAEFGVKQHISRSIRSLFLLSKASGIDREEFERIVQTELDVAGMIEDEM
ncbi:uncharacterized protein B0T15DRAFT_518888 [Chaetomium strumarium]|uniref:Uncharacterized protein n=1 Tax=Chaetomium strumarium TaxID=1170767 RepID=A0AAJ0H2K6_9PEZI|nr:hypothetical protein B0T15DRAFT_518888 [Chaetomium strumarium]